VAGVWGVDPESLPGPGVPAVELLRRLGTETGPRALLVHRSNIAVSAPNADEVKEALKRLDLLVVADLVPSETAELADVVLPVTQWAEEDGTMTNLEGRILRRRKAADAPGEARSELWILAELARRMGVDGFSEEPSEVFDELARASAGGPADYSGVSYARLDAGEQIHWPCPASDDAHPGTPRVFLESFPTPDGRARMVPVEYVGPRDDVRGDAPVYLVTGRVLTQYQSGAQTRRVGELVDSEPQPYVEIHPSLAETYRIEDGALVELTTARGSVQLVARLSVDTRPDTVFVPFHWPGSANVLTNDATDPTSGMPEFKVCAVSLRAVVSKQEVGV